MYLSQIATLCSHLKFKRINDEKYIFFDEHSVLSSDDGRPVRVTKEMLEMNDWEPKCDHPRTSILIEATTSGTIFQCKECLQQVEPVGFKKIPPTVPDIPKQVKGSYVNLNML